MAGIKTFRDLKIWQKSLELTVEVYEMTKSFPKEEQFGLTSQIRRASISISSNIAEGFGRRSEKDFARFLSISIGSLFEVQSQLEICFKLNILSKDIYLKIFELTREIERMIVAFKKKLTR